MPRIIVNPKIPFDVNLRKFKSLCNKDGIRQEAKERMHYIKPTEKRKAAKIEAIRRAKNDERIRKRWS